MIADPVVELLMLAGLCALVWRVLHRSPRVSMPSWFMVETPPRPPSLTVRVIVRPYDWETDDAC